MAASTAGPTPALELANMAQVGQSRQHALSEPNLLKSRKYALPQRRSAASDAEVDAEDFNSMSKVERFAKLGRQTWHNLKHSAVPHRFRRKKVKVHRAQIKTATQLMAEKHAALTLEDKASHVHSFRVRSEAHTSKSGRTLTRRHTCILRPQSPIRLTWDVTTLFLLLYIAVTTPYQIGFSVEADGAQYYFERIIDVFFITDLFLNFRTGYVSSDGKEELGACKIAKNYLISWFGIDLVSSIPFDFILAGLDSLKSTKVLKAGRVVKAFRVIRLTKLVRFLKLAVFIEKLEENFSINRNLLLLFKLLLGTVVMCHFFACTWFYIGSFTESPDGWVQVQGLQNAPTGTQYLASFYWAVATLATVGYGDIVPISKAERTFGVIGMLLGGGYFGYIIATMAALVAKLDASTQRYHDKMDAIVSYMKSRNLPREMQVRIRRYYKHYLEKKTAFDEGSILNELSTFLRQEVAMFLVNDTLFKIPLFADVEPSFIAMLVPQLQPLTCGNGDFVMRRGEFGREMYIVIRGEAELFRDDETTTDGDMPVVLMGPGSYFGEMAVLYAHRFVRRETVRAIDHCELYSLSRDALLSICSDFPALLDRMRKTARAAAAEMRREWREQGVEVSDSDSDSVPETPQDAAVPWLELTADERASKRSHIDTIVEDSKMGSGSVGSGTRFGTPPTEGSDSKEAPGFFHAMSNHSLSQPPVTAVPHVHQHGAADAGDNGDEAGDMLTVQAPGAGAGAGAGSPSATETQALLNQVRRMQSRGSEGAGVARSTSMSATSLRSPMLVDLPGSLRHASGNGSSPMSTTALDDGASEDGDVGATLGSTAIQDLLHSQDTARTASSDSADDQLTGVGIAQAPRSAGRSLPDAAAHAISGNQEARLAAFEEIARRVRMLLARMELYVHDIASMPVEHAALLSRPVTRGPGLLLLGSKSVTDAQLPAIRQRGRSHSVVATSDGTANARSFLPLSSNSVGAIGTNLTPLLYTPSLRRASGAGAGAGVGAGAGATTVEGSVSSAAVIQAAATAATARSRSRNSSISGSVAGGGGSTTPPLSVNEQAVQQQRQALVSLHSELSQQMQLLGSLMRRF